MSVSRWFMLSLVWAAGIVTIVGSSFKEDEPPPPPPVPVTVRFNLTSNDLQRDLGSREAELNNLALTGTYAADQGDKLTLDRDSIELDANSGFMISISASGDELLQGDSDIDITDALDVGLSRNPVGGQFTSLFEDTVTMTETTTTVTVTANGVDVLVGPATTADSYSWTDFEALEDDNDADLDLRMASAAYNMLDAVLRAALLIEDIIDDIESNKDTLEAMNTGSERELTCDNSTTSSATYTLVWTSDAVGSIQGEIDDDDAFEVVYNNCQIANRDRFLDGTVLLDNYNPADSDILSTLEMNADFSLLYLSETEDPTTPGTGSPRLNGGLFLSYSEQADTQ